MGSSNSSNSQKAGKGKKLKSVDFQVAFEIQKEYLKNMNQKSILHYEKSQNPKNKDYYFKVSKTQV